MNSEPFYFIHPETKKILTKRDIGKQKLKVDVIPYNPPKFLKNTKNGRIYGWTLILSEREGFEPVEINDTIKKTTKKLLIDACTKVCNDPNCLCEPKLKFSME